MKRCISLTLVLMLSLTLFVPALAVEEESTFSSIETKIEEEIETEKKQNI